MSLIETESLVLKTYNLAEADKIVVLFTHDQGLVRAVAKGAKRLKSRFGSSLEPFTLVRSTYFQKENSELASLDKIEIVQSVFQAASDPLFLQKFSYLAELLITFLPPHDPNEALFRMARACVRQAVEDPASIPSLGVYFEIWLLRLTGYLPDWTKCQQCRRPLDNAESADLQANFHLMCERCRRSKSNRVLDGPTRAIISDAMRSAPADFAEGSRNSGERLTELSATLRGLITHSLGREVSGETSISRPA